MKKPEYIDEINELLKTHGEALTEFYDSGIVNGFKAGVWTSIGVGMIGYLTIKLGKELYESHKFHKELYKEES